MKTKLFMVSLLLITVIACKKQSTPTVQKSNNSTTTAYVSPLTGTWVNSQDVTDYFSIKDTVCTGISIGNPGCYHRIIIQGAGKYLGYSNNEFAQDTMITNAPGITRNYIASNSIAYPDHIYYTGSVIKIQIDNCPGGNPNKTLIFNKQ